MSEGKNGNEANSVHSSWRICRFCAANVRNAGIIGTGWLVGYNEAAKKGDFAQAESYLKDFATHLDEAAIRWDDASTHCQEAGHVTPWWEETGVHGEGQRGSEAEDGTASENA